MCPQGNRPAFYSNGSQNRTGAKSRYQKIRRHRMIVSHRRMAEQMMRGEEKRRVEGRKEEGKRRKGIGKNTEQGIATIAIGSFVWTITCRSVRERRWRMFLRLVFVSTHCRRAADLWGQRGTCGNTGMFELTSRLQSGIQERMKLLCSSSSLLRLGC